MFFTKKISNNLFIIITVFFLKIEARDSFFITDKEYGKMLYSQPRGIGCNMCHGSNGKSFLIYNYPHKGKKLSLTAPNINNISFKKFKKAIKEPRVSIMPQYDLTDLELNTLYSYLVQGDSNVTRR